MSPEEIKRLQALASQAGASRQAAQPAPTKIKGRGGFLTSLISELGGAGGAAGGAAIGAGIGSVVPVLGTAVGGIIGAGIGGFAGGAGGRLAENKIRDDEFRVSQALKEGAVSGAFGAAGTGFQALKGAKALKAIGATPGIKAGFSGANSQAMKLAMKNPKNLSALQSAVGALPSSTDDLAKIASEKAALNKASLSAFKKGKPTQGFADEYLKLFERENALLTKGSGASSKLPASVKATTAGLNERGALLTKILDRSKKSVAQFDEAFKQTKAIEKGIENPGKIKQLGDALTKSSLGIKGGAGATSKNLGLTVKESDELLKYAGKTGLTKGTPQQRLKAVENAVKVAGKNIDDVISKSNKAVAPQALDDITANITRTLNTTPGLSLTPGLTDDLAKLKQVKDIKGLNAFKQGIDDMINYSRTSGSPDPTKEALNKVLRREISKKIDALAPALKDANKQFSIAKKAQQYLAVSAKSPKGLPVPLMGGVARGGVAPETTQQALGLVGRTLSRVGGVTGSDPMRMANKVLKGAAVRGIANQAITPPEMPGAQDPAMMGGVVDPQAAVDFPQVGPDGPALFGPQVGPNGEAASTGGQVLGASTDIPSNAMGATNPGMGVMGSNGMPRPAQIQQMLQQAALGALKDGNTAALKDIMAASEFFRSFEPEVDKASQKPMSAAAAESLAGANAGLAGIDLLREEMMKDPGARQRTVLPGRGILGGLGNNMLGTSNYQAAFGNILDSWARVKTGAAISNTEERRFNANLPSPFDPPETVQKKLTIIEDLFNTVANRTGTAGTDVEALIGGQ